MDNRSDVQAARPGRIPGCTVGGIFNIGDDIRVYRIGNNHAGCIAWSEIRYRQLIFDRLPNRYRHCNSLLNDRQVSRRCRERFGHRMVVGGVRIEGIAVGRGPVPDRIGHSRGHIPADEDVVSSGVTERSELAGTRPWIPCISVVGGKLGICHRSRDGVSDHNVGGVTRPVVGHHQCPGDLCPGGDRGRGALDNGEVGGIVHSCRGSGRIVGMNRIVGCAVNSCGVQEHRTVGDIRIYRSLYFNAEGGTDRQ